MENRIYKEGDKVRLKNNLIPNKDYDGCSISPRDYSYFKDCDCIIDILIADTNRYGLLIERDGKLIYGVEANDLMLQPLERIPEETKDDDELERVLSNMLGDFERGQGYCELEDFVKFVKEREDIARKEASKVEPLQNGEREEIKAEFFKKFVDETDACPECVGYLDNMNADDVWEWIESKLSQSKKECIFTSEELRRIRKIVVEAELPLKKYFDVDIQILKKLSLYEESLTNQKKDI